MFAVMSNELTTTQRFFTARPNIPNIQRGSVFGNTVGNSTPILFSDNGAQLFRRVDANTVNQTCCSPATTTSGRRIRQLLLKLRRWQGNFAIIGTNGLAATGWAGQSTRQTRQRPGVLRMAVQNLTTTRLHEALSKTGDSLALLAVSFPPMVRLAPAQTASSFRDVGFVFPFAHRHAGYDCGAWICHCLRRLNRNPVPHDPPLPDCLSASEFSQATGSLRSDLLQPTRPNIVFIMSDDHAAHRGQPRQQDQPDAAILITREGRHPLQ